MFVFFSYRSSLIIFNYGTDVGRNDKKTNGHIGPIAQQAAYISVPSAVKLDAVEKQMGRGNRAELHLLAVISLNSS